MTMTVGGTSGLVFPDSSTQNTAATGFGFKNRLINGNMAIDQRNAGASVTPSSGNTYIIDRWKTSAVQSSKFTIQQNAGSVTPPAGFKNYLGVTSSSAYTVLSTDYFVVSQLIEGLNVADFNWGTANAQPITISFWVRSSLTGVIGGAVQNSAQTRSYPFTFSVSSANTWEQKTITIAGDTSGTWLTTSGIGFRLNFNLGSGSTMSATASTWAAGEYYAPTSAVQVVATNGATFYITGVQLEKGSTATSFDYRPYGTELALCQRYYYKVTAGSNVTLAPYSYANGTTTAKGSVQFPVTMRTSPSALEQSGTASNYQVVQGATGATTCSSIPTFDTSNTEFAQVIFTVASGLTGGQAGYFRSAAVTTAYLAWSAEL